LHEAALCGKLEVVKVLLDSNINVELRDQVFEKFNTHFGADEISRLGIKTL